MVNQLCCAIFFSSLRIIPQKSVGIQVFMVQKRARIENAKNILKMGDLTSTIVNDDVKQMY